MIDRRAVSRFSHHATQCSSPFVTVAFANADASSVTTTARPTAMGEAGRQRMSTTLKQQVQSCSTTLQTTNNGCSTQRLLEWVTKDTIVLPPRLLTLNQAIVHIFRHRQESSSMVEFPRILEHIHTIRVTHIPTVRLETLKHIIQPVR